MNNLVILDEEVLNPGDNPWDSLAVLGQLRVYAHTAPENLFARCKDANAVFVNKITLDSALIKSLHRLQYIGLLSTGYDIIDIDAAGKAGVTVCNVPGYGTDAVAQHVFALLFALFRRVESHAAGVAAGRWSQKDTWCYWDSPQIDLAGKTLGVVGFGDTGQRVAGLGRAFGMNVLAYAPRPKPAPDYAPFAFRGLAELFSESDVISLHCPLAQDNRGFVNKELLSLLRPGSYLINTARGPLVDEPALCAALESGRLAGAGLDVLPKEPPAQDSPLLTAPNCLITPHLAWATLRARRALSAAVTENFRAWLDGKPRNVVNAKYLSRAGV